MHLVQWRNNRTDGHVSCLVRARPFSDGLKYEGWNELIHWHHQMGHLQVEKLLLRDTCQFIWPENIAIRNTMQENCKIPRTRLDFRRSLVSGRTAARNRA